MSNSRGRCILITGGVHRLGLHLACAFAEHGAILGLNYYTASHEEAESAKSECLRRGAKDVILLPGDVTREAEMITQRFVDATGALHTLVNNAGVMPARKPLADLSLEQFRSTVELNLLAPFAMSKAAASHMTEGSAIINLASLGGMQIWNRRIDYNTSKSALITLTKALARELAPRRITVNAIAPGAIQVEDEGAERMGIAEDKIPMGHYGNPGDIAKAALFLAYEAPYMTGETLIIDGGRHLIG